MKILAGTKPENKKPPSGVDIPPVLNVSLAAFHLLSSLYLFFLLPLFLLPINLWWGLSGLAVGALSNSFWSLIHEAIHDMWHPSARVNTAAGRLMGIFFGSPFQVLRISHLMHHRLNRSPIEATELYDPEATSRARAALAYYFQILGGLYAVELVSGAFFLLPRRWLAGIERRCHESKALSGMLLGVLTKAETLSELRADGVAALALLAAGFLCYGERWLWLAGALAARAFLISFLDNIYHYRTPVNDVLYADNLWLPPWLSTPLLHFNLHGVHHRNTAVPWSSLPAVFALQSAGYQGNYFTASARQLSGPIPLSELTRSPR